MMDLISFDTKFKKYTGNGMFSKRFLNILTTIQNIQITFTICYWNLDHFYNLLLDHQEEISNLLTLLEFYFSIQSSSAESERVFSKMNNIKTKNRNQMEIDKLINLILISSAEVKSNKISDGCLYDRWKDKKIKSHQEINLQF